MGERASEGAKSIDPMGGPLWEAAEKVARWPTGRSAARSLSRPLPRQAPPSALA